MAWTSPKVWAADELLTASDLNQYLSDNLSALYALTQGGGRKNLLHNGAMQVHQRAVVGTGVTGITTSSFNTADRWWTGLATLGTWTQSVENDAPTGSGFRKSLKMLCSSADASPAVADQAYLQYGIEGQNLQTIKKGTTSAEQLTLSFWVKSNKTGTYIAELYDADNSRHCAKAYTIAASATWEQQTITFPADLTGAFDNDSAGSLYLYFHLAEGGNFTSGTLATTWASYTAANRAVGQTNLAASNSNYWQVTGVQLEVGSAATGFEYRDYGTELADCQRYYQRFWSDSAISGNGAYVGSGQIYSGSSAYIQVPLITTMRDVPGVAYAGSVAAGHYSYTGANATSLGVYGGSTPGVVTLQAGNSGTAWLASTGWCCLKIAASASPGTTNNISFSAEI